MSENLVQFLAQNQIEGITKEVCIGGRLKGFTFKIKPMNSNQFYKYQQLSTAIGKDKNVKFNSGRFNELVILNHVIEPNLRSTDVLSSAGCGTPEEYLNKVFLAGELIELSDKISQISGFNQSDEQLEEQVKNS